MNEQLSELAHGERLERIRDIRERKGYLLGRGVLIAGNTGFVSGYTIFDTMKYSVLVQGGYLESDKYVYKGVPKTEIRQLPDEVSEFSEKQVRNLP